MPNIILSSQPSWLPVIKQLPADYQLYCLQSQFTKTLNDIDIPAKSIAEMLDDRARATAMRDASKLHVELAQCAMPVFEHSKQVTQWLGEQGIARYFYPRLVDLSLAISALENSKSDLLVLHNDVEPLHRLLAFYARKRQIPVLHIPHAIYFDTPERGPIGTDVHDLVTADHLAAAGPFQAQWYHTRDPKQHIYMTGLPQFDRLAHQKRDRERACKLLHLDPYKPILVYMSSWGQTTNLLGCHNGVEDTYRNLLLAMRELPDIQLVVKCHPRGNNVEWHAKLAHEMGQRAIVTAEHLDAVLMVADTVLSYGPSNVVLEAAAIPGTRLMAIDGFMADPEVLTISGEVNDIITGIAQVFTQPPIDTSNFLARYLGILDGKAATRIAQLIQKLVS